MSTENNRLIAEFMDFDKCTDPNCKENPCYYVGDYMKAHDLRFHDSWDWIMPVLEKIKYLIPETEFSYRFKDALFKFSKKAVDDAVVEFILWYNKNK